MEAFGGEIEALRYYVGEDRIADPLYYVDRDPTEDVILSGRNIAQSPYKLLVRPPGDNDERGDEIVVGVLAFGDADRMIGFGRLPHPVSFVKGSVLEWDIEIQPLGPDVSVADNDCLKWQIETGEWVHVGRRGDADCDGYTVDGGDCDDLNPAVSPGAPEDCQNGLDDNCNALTDGEDVADLDEDGFGACGPEGERDCNDNVREINPDAPEVCDGLDNNCDSLCDESFDKDNDLVTTCGSLLLAGACVAEGEPDCNDENEYSFPGNPEICDGVDNDCSGRCDDDPGLDTDQDNYTECGSRIGECGVEDYLVDCAPEDYAIHPGAQDYCDGVDNDCDGADAESSPCYAVAGGTVCIEGARVCADGALQPECLADVVNANDLPDEICTIYTGCQEAALVPDPFSCILDLAASEPPNEICQVMIEGSNTCPGRIVTIVPDGGPAVSDICSYALLGGEEQQGYRLALVALGGETGQVVEGCSAGLSVEALPGAGDAVVAIVFTDTVNGVTQMIRVKLKSHRIEFCGDFAGLQCETWSAP